MNRDDVDTVFDHFKVNGNATLETYAADAWRNVIASNSNIWRLSESTTCRSDSFHIICRILRIETRRQVIFKIE